MTVFVKHFMNTMNIRKKLLHYSRKRVKADRVCSINNNEIGNVRLRSLCPSIKMSRCFFFHFSARRVGPYRICVTSKNKIAYQSSASYKSWYQILI